MVYAVGLLKCQGHRNLKETGRFVKISASEIHESHPHNGQLPKKRLIIRGKVKVALAVLSYQCFTHRFKIEIFFPDTKIVLANFGKTILFVKPDGSVVGF